MSLNNAGLSQDQIDALLASAPAAAAAAAPVPGPTGGAAAVFGVPEGDVTIYDFRRPRRVSKERLRALEAMYERMIRSLEGWGVGRMRGPLEMRLQGVEQLTFQEYQLSLTNPCAAYTFDIADSAGQQGVINIGQELAFFAVDRLFGGQGVEYLVPERPLSPIERNAVRTIAERTLALLTDVWQDHVKLELELAGFESAPEIVQAANPDDPMLVATVDCKSGTRASLMTICLPFSVLDKFFTSGDQRKATLTAVVRENEVARQLAEQGLRATGLEVACRLPVTAVPMHVLQGLQPGAVLALGIRKDALIEVHLEGQHRFSGVGGHSDGYYAVVLTEEAVQRGDTRGHPKAKAR